MSGRLHEVVEEEEGKGEGEVGTLSATSTVCVLLAIPTTTEPCFTASDAYST